MNIKKIATFLAMLALVPVAFMPPLASACPKKAAAQAAAGAGANVVIQQPQLALAVQAPPTLAIVNQPTQLALLSTQQVCKQGLFARMAANKQARQTQRQVNRSGVTTNAQLLSANVVVGGPPTAQQAPPPGFNLVVPGGGGASASASINDGAGIYVETPNTTVAVKRYRMVEIQDDEQPAPEGATAAQKAEAAEGPVVTAIPDATPAVESRVDFEVTMIPTYQLRMLTSSLTNTAIPTLAVLTGATNPTVLLARAAGTHGVFWHIIHPFGGRHKSVVKTTSRTRG